MAFVSYAQNFEDVMLWRCFGHLKKGFYVDIGADDPTIDSVTKSFYEMGWSGINIEPTESAFKKLEADRPRDTNLKAAVSVHSGAMDFWVIANTGLSTAVEKFAAQHKLAGHAVSKISVKALTLKEICAEFVHTPVHFMKIDVEGFEREVLSSGDFEKFRPEVILVESTEPNSQFESQDEWEQILVENDYIFCYADGLNRFYVSKESQHLKIHFTYPPNVFDNFVLSTDWRIHTTHLDNSERLKVEATNEYLDDQRNDLIDAVITAENLTAHEKKRILMTVSCADSELIPRVPEAGKIFTSAPSNFQLMHNGLKIVEGCYYGPWMTHIIKILKGHHEPQEEYAFYKVMEYLTTNPSEWGAPRMIELGSFWAYYSMWFLKSFPNGTSYCFEPDPNYLQVGKENFVLNNLSGNFINAKVSNQVSMSSEFLCESDGNSITVPALDFTSIIESTGQNQIDIVLVDIQGAEIALLENLSKALTNSTIRFLMISTHDFEISGSPITHQLALEFLTQNGAHIILEHSVSESYSGDGFILASFDEVDKNLQIPISYNRSRNSLFGEWEPRMHKLQEELRQQEELLVQQSTRLIQQRDELTQQRDELTQQRDELTQQNYRLLNSTIWKVTKPVRVIVNFLRKRR